MSYWGYHLILDCANCNNNIKNKDKIIQFAKHIVKQIDMIAHGEPIVEYMLPGDPKQGYSLVQLITTSNITAHFIEPDYTAYFDIFSCKEFSIEVAKKCIVDAFGCTFSNTLTLCRQA